MNWEKIQSERKWLIVYLLLTTIYLIWRIFFTLPLDYGFWAIVFGIILLVAECSGVFDFLVHFIGMTRLVVPVKPELEESASYPEVDVFIATYNEPWEIIYKTVIGCKNMSYPDKNKVHIYVLDDGRRQEIQKLCQQVSVGYITRETNEHAKAGNINHALTQTKSPYVVTFDADMIPMHHFLMETLPYFIDNQLVREIEQQKGIKEKKMTPKIGFIQVPQAFYNPDIFQYQLFSEDIIPNEQDYFHREVQLSKNASNSVIYSGSNTIISREALEEIDGFVTGIITEDIATGIKIQEKGYRCYAINQVLASGLAPYDLEAIIKQRNRWARGCVQTFRRVNPLFSKKLTLMQRVNYFDAMLYWYAPFKRFIYMLAPILFTVFGLRVVDASLLEVLIFWLPCYIFNTVMFKKFSGNGRTMKWTNIYDTILMPTLMPAVLFETLGLKMKTFEVTSKKRNINQQNKYRLKLAIPHSVLFFLTIMGLSRAVIEIIQGNGDGYFINLFWLLLNGYTLMMALFFILERPVYRSSERFNIKTNLSFVVNDEKYKEETFDVSETGLSFVSDYPHYFQPNHTYSLTIGRDTYEATIEAEFLRVDSLGENQHKYVFKYQKMDQKNYEQLILILFDRMPNFPTKIMSQSIFRDIWVNLNKRWQRQRTYRRQYPRVKVNQSVRVRTKSGEQVCHLKEFNYDYLVLNSSEKLDELSLIVGSDGLEIKYQLVRPLKRKKYYLYQIVKPMTSSQLEIVKREVETWITVDKAYSKKQFQ